MRRQEPPLSAAAQRRRHTEFGQTATSATSTSNGKDHGACSAVRRNPKASPNPRRINPWMAAGWQRRVIHGTPRSSRSRQSCVIQSHLLGPASSRSIDCSIPFTYKYPLNHMLTRPVPARRILHSPHAHYALITQHLVHAYYTTSIISGSSGDIVTSYPPALIHLGRYIFRTGYGIRRSFWGEPRRTNGQGCAASKRK